MFLINNTFPIFRSLHALVTITFFFLNVIRLLEKKQVNFLNALDNLEKKEGEFFSIMIYLPDFKDMYAAALSNNIGVIQFRGFNDFIPRSKYEKVLLFLLSFISFVELD